MVCVNVKKKTFYEESLRPQNCVKCAKAHALVFTIQKQAVCFFCTYALVRGAGKVPLTLPRDVTFIWALNLLF